MSTNIVDCPADQLKIGMPVFEPVNNGIALIKFRPAGGDLDNRHQSWGNQMTL